MALGIYISVPFCRTKCSFCNFASDVFSRAVFAKYIDRICAEVAAAPQTPAEMGGEFERQVDSIYLGGGTPTMLDSADLQRIFAAVRSTFNVAPDCEITVECAPGTLTDALLDVLLRCGVNRVSLGVQSFIDEELRSVGRLHTRDKTLDDIARLRVAGIADLNLDLIAGLPHQTPESWRVSLAETIATGAPHVSVYMLEIDEDSRLGRELIAGGTRYHAHFVPNEELTADLYLEACHTLNAAGVCQYEISNFARAGLESRHNLKYWTRQPYLGFGVDAHSMLPAATGQFVAPASRRRALLPSHKRVAGENHEGGSRPCAFTADDVEAVRFATPDSLEAYLAGVPLTRTIVYRSAAREEEFFLGLRLTHGVDLRRIGMEYGADDLGPVLRELVEAELLEHDGDWVRLTERGRLLSNEVFARFLA